MSKCNIVINGVKRSGHYYADIRVRSLNEGQTIKTMGEDEYDEFEMLNESCSMMTAITNAYYEIVPRELDLVDDIVVDNGSPEHMFRRREDILRLVTILPLLHHPLWKIGLEKAREFPSLTILPQISAPFPLPRYLWQLGGKDGSQHPLLSPMTIPLLKMSTPLLLLS